MSAAATATSSAAAVAPNAAAAPAKEKEDSTKCTHGAGAFLYVDESGSSDGQLMLLTTSLDLFFLRMAGRRFSDMAGMLDEQKIDMFVIHVLSKFAKDGSWATNLPHSRVKWLLRKLEFESKCKRRLADAEVESEIQKSAGPTTAAKTKPQNCL